MPAKGREVVVCAENRMSHGSEYFGMVVVDSSCGAEKVEIAADMVNRMAARSAMTHMIAECIWCC